MTAPVPSDIDGPAGEAEALARRNGFNQIDWTPNPDPAGEAGDLIERLKWNEPTRSTNGCFTAETPFGTYSLVNEDGWHVGFEHGGYWDWDGDRILDTQHTAMDAAQAHFESLVAPLVAAHLAALQQELDLRAGDKQSLIADLDLEIALRKASEALASSLQRRVEELTQPDMFWDADDPEVYFSDPEEHADASGERTLYFRAQCAKRLPDVWFAAEYVDGKGWQINSHASEQEASAALPPPEQGGKP